MTVEHGEVGRQPAQVLVLGPRQLDSFLALAPCAFAENREALSQAEVAADLVDAPVDLAEQRLPLRDLPRRFSRHLTVCSHPEPSTRNHG